MNYVRGGVLGVGVAVLMSGCASSEDPALRQLSRQQAATVASLSTEVMNLNRELEGTISSREDLQAALPVLEKALATEISRGEVRVSLGREGLAVTILDHALFDPEEIKILPSGEESLDKIAAVLSEGLSAQRIAVEGYTDNRPVEGAEGLTNWEYSVDCAATVLHYFVDSKKLSPERFKVSGFGEYRPVASNETEEGRAQNRRVSIVVMP